MVWVYNSIGAEDDLPKAQSSVQFTNFLGLSNSETITLLSLNMPWAHYVSRTICAELPVLERKAPIPSLINPYLGR